DHTVLDADPQEHRRLAFAHPVPLAIDRVVQGGRQFPQFAGVGEQRVEAQVAVRALKAGDQGVEDQFVPEVNVSDQQSILPPLISADRLSAMLGAPGVVIVDASWYLPSAGRDPEAEYSRAHIPGAIRLPLDAISDPDDSLPHMLPSPDRFASQCEAIGISRRHQLVIYVGSGVNLSAARVWWTFRVFGHTTVSVLDGGIRAWASATRPVQVGVQRRPRTGYPVPERDGRLVVD